MKKEVLNITITGPRSVGKTTISKIVAKKLNLKYISSDEIGHKALKKQGGLDKAIKSGIIKKFIEKRGYDLITRIYKKEKNYIFDLSGGSFTYKDFPRASEEVRQFAKKNSVVIGLLPSRCFILSIFTLFSREKKRAHFKDFNKLTLFWKTLKRHPRFLYILRRNANFIIYIRNKTPEQIANEIVTKYSQ